MQTTYSNVPGAAFAGMLGDSKPADILSRALGGSVNVGFGLMLEYGATPTTEAAPLADGATLGDLVGVTVHRHTQDRASLTGTHGITPNSTMDLLRKGRVWVVVEEAVTPGDAVFVRHTAAGLEVKGAFRNDADGGDAVDISTKARWESTTTGAGIALLDLNLP
jgi:hypothetical protein